MTPEQRNQLLRTSQSFLPIPLEDVFDSTSASAFVSASAFASASTASSSTSTDRTTPPSSPSRMRVPSRGHAKAPVYPASSSSKSTSHTRKSSALHARTSTPSISTVLPSFLAQQRCARCTVKIVYVSKPSSSKPQRALVRWGVVPYFTTAGKPAEFVYHTFEQLTDLRPELVARWEDDQKRHRRESGSGSGNPSSDWANDKRRDSWVIEQLAYWVEFLNEWKFYREYYVFREELFGGEVPEVPSPECEHCVRRKP